MVNAARGEVSLNVGDTKYRLCLTLGALAEIEESLGIEDLSKIGDVFSKPKMSHIMGLLLALAHGGGHEELTLKDVKKWKVSLSELLPVLQRAFSLSATDEESEGAGSGNA